MVAARELVRKVAVELRPLDCAVIVARARSEDELAVTSAEALTKSRDDAVATRQGPVAESGAVTGELSLAETEYLEFYHIHFAREVPGLRQHLGAMQFGDQQLAVHVFLQPSARGVLLLVHGYLDHVGLFGHLIRFGLERGYTVVAFDLPGHGLSSGDRVAIDDFGDYRRAVESVMTHCAPLPGSWRVIAQSTGGAAVVDYLLHHPDKLEKVVLLAPLVRPRSWWWVKSAHALLHRFRDTMPRGFAENSNDPEFLRWIRTDPLQSTVISMRWIGALRRWLKNLPQGNGECEAVVLLIQGDADGTVDWRYNVNRIQRLISGTQLVILEGARHHLANESPPIRSRIYAHIDEFFSSAAVPH